MIKHCKTQFLVKPLLSKKYIYSITFCTLECGFLHYIAGTIGKVQDQHLLVAPVLFCCLKISLYNFTDRVTNLIAVVSVRAKRGKNLHVLTTFTRR